jgi:hypothetical protein
MLWRLFEEAAFAMVKDGFLLVSRVVCYYQQIGWEYMGAIMRFRSASDRQVWLAGLATFMPASRASEV